MENSSRISKIPSRMAVDDRPLQSMSLANVQFQVRLI